MANEGQIITATAELLQRYDTLFGISKNVARAIPNVRDGLKPVQRKILYVMNTVAPDKLAKVNTIMGEVQKIYSHGDSSITDALIRLGSDWGNISPYIIGHGNFGCHDNRTEVLTRNGWMFFKDITLSTQLATMDPETRELYYEYPANIFSYNAGNHPFKMYKCDIPGKLNFCITNTHKMLVGKKLVPCNRIHSKFKVNNAIRTHEVAYPEHTKDTYTIAGLYQIYGTEIFMSEHCLTQTPDSIRFKVTDNEPVDKKFQYLQAYRGIHIEKTEDGYLLEDVGVVSEIRNLWNGSPRTVVPEALKHMESTLIKEYLDTYTESLNLPEQNKPEYITYTVNQVNAETMQLLYFLSGQCTVVEKLKIPLYHNHRHYQYGIRKVQNISVLDPKKDLPVTEYYGTVYCAEVPTHHTLITRRQGYILISGNSVMGDAPAAARYIEAMLSPFARQCFFTDKLCIDMVPTYDNTRMEPDTLPCMFPTAIINGSTGSGFGQSTNIPQYNLKDVIEKTIELIDDPKAPGYLIPDSHWGCDIGNSKVTGKYKTSFEHIYETGYGCYVQSFRYQIDHQRNVVIVTALPAKVILEDILKEIERLQNENKAFPELKSMVDLSGKDHNNGVWVEFALYEGKNPYRFINKLATVKDMRKTVKVNVDLVDGLEVIHYSVRSYILTWYHYRYDYIRAVTSTQLISVDSDIAINDIKLFIFGEDRLDRTVEIYRNSRDKADIIERLMKEYSKVCGMTSQQANILAEMSGKDYTKSALARYRELKPKLQAERDRLEGILTSKDGINNIIKEQLRSGLKFARPRGAKIIGKSKEVQDDTVVLAINPKVSGIIKLPDNESSAKLVSRLPSTLCLSMDSSYNAIVFDTNGRYVILNPGEIPMMKSLDQMVPINRYINKPLGTLIAMECQDEDCRSFMVVTRFGKVKKIDPSNYRNSKNNFYIGLDEKDSVVSVIPIHDIKSHVIVYTDNGNGQRFPNNIIQTTSATAAGTYGVTVPEGENLMGGFCVSNADLIVYVTRKGMIRVNHSKFFLARKNKKDWIHLIEIKKPDELVTAITCTAKDTLRIVYDDFSIKDILVNEIPIDTMNSPMRNLLYQPHKKVLNVKRVISKKKAK